MKTNNKADNKNVVMLLTQNYLPSLGYYQKIRNEINILQKYGYKVTIVCWDRHLKSLKYEEIDGLVVHRIYGRSRDMRGPFQLYPLFLFLIRAFFLIRTLNPGILHSHNIDTLPTTLWYKFRFKTKVILDAHEPDYYATWPKKFHFLLNIVWGLEKWMSKKADHIIVVNDYQLNKYGQFGIKDITVVLNFPSPELTVDVIDDNKFNKDECVFGRLGSFYEDVGLEEIVESFKIVSSRHPHARLFLAGKVMDGYQEKFDSIIDPVRSKIKLIGAFPLDKMKELYQEIDVSILLYRRTLWFQNVTPTKYADTLANGVPMLMTDIGGLGKEIDEYKLGIVVDENNIESIVSGMEKFIEDKAFRRKCSENCLNLANSKYNWRLMDGLIKNIYEKVCD